LKWEEKLALHHMQLKTSIQTGNFTYVTIRQAQYIDNGINHAATYKALRGNALKGLGSDRADLDQINTDTAQSGQTAFEQFQNYAQGPMKDEAKTTDDCLARLAQKRDEMKATLDDNVDKAFAKASDAIKATPPADQQKATDIFCAGSTFATNAINVVLGKLNDLLGSVLDFFKGIWTSMVNAYNVVKDGVTNAINCIKGLFSLSFTAKMPAKYEGVVGWKAGISFKDANAAYVKLITYIEDNIHGNITDQSFTREENGFIATVEFSKKEGGGTVKELEGGWDDAVASIKGPYMYVPEAERFANGFIA
jgi:hypothetical protein